MLQMKSVVSEKDNFYRGLSKLCAVENNGKLHINGDFTATTSIFEYHFSFDGKMTSTFETETSNCNGEFLLKFYYSTRFLAVFNFWTHKKSSVLDKGCSLDTTITGYSLDSFGKVYYFKKLFRIFITRKMLNIIYLLNCLFKRY